MIQGIPASILQNRRAVAAGIEVKPTLRRLSALCAFGLVAFSQCAFSAAINAGGGAAGSFTADTGYSGGTAVSNTSATIDTSGTTSPAPQAVYQTERYGNFSYTIGGLTPSAAYRVRLHFAESYWKQSGQRVFNVAINGSAALTNFDIFAAAGAYNKAVIKEFNASANSSGNVVIQFTSVVNFAKVDGIEVLPAGSIAIDAGGAATGGFVADTDFSGGTAYSNTSATVDVSGVTNPAPQDAYHSERYGNFTYTIPGLMPSASYKLRLHFVEAYWTQAGQRTFNVAVNGSTVLSTFDIVAAAGAPLKAVVREFTVPANASGSIAIQFTSVVNYAKVDAIEVLPITTTPPVAIPSAPVNLTAQAGDSTASLSWNSASGATSYNVKRSLTSGGPYSLVASNVTGTSYSNTGLANGTTYYYVVSAVNSAGESANSAEVAASPTAVVSANTNYSGINLGGTLDWQYDRLYADVMRMSRGFGSAPVDSLGWPMSDFTVTVWGGIDKMNGTYALSFKGQASVSSSVGNVALTYDAATNTSSGTLQFTNSASSSLSLTFSGTRRTPTSASGTGVTQIKLMRPVTPGATQTHATTELFNRATKGELSKFKVIRYVDFLAANSNAQTNWSDRPLPDWASFNRNPGGAYGWEGIGGPWEHISRLSNELGVEPWINIPVRATDDYIRKVAQLFAYGSDGMNPYTSPQANPVYPPLNPNIRIYVEYSNELWNGGSGFNQAGDNCQAASNELVSTSGNSPLNYDKKWNGVTWPNSSFDWTMCWRRAAKRGAEISQIFRSVFGDAAMGTRVRPILASQLGYASGPLTAGMQMMFGYYDNGEGNFVATPHSPSYYFYGAGGSAYYSPGSVSTLDQLFANLSPSNFVGRFRQDAALTAAMGVKRVAYEGGPGLDRTGTSVDTIYAQAVADPRMTTTVVNMHNSAWTATGGDLLVYYQAAGDFQWGFTDSVYNLSTPKLAAIDTLNASQPASLTYGTLIPGTVSGTNTDVCSLIWTCSPMQPANFAASGGGAKWASYSFRATQSAQRSVTLNFSSASSAQAAVYVDGVLIGTQSTFGGSLVFNAGTLSAGLHGIVVRAVSGSFTLGSVAVQ